MITTTRHTDPIATIELIGSYTACHVESGTTVDLTGRRNKRTTKSPIPVLCRELLTHGLDPETRTLVVRRYHDRDGFMPVFNRNRTIAVWAGLDVIESENESLRITKHRPYRGPVKAREGHPATATPNDTGETPRSKFATTAHRQTITGEAA